MGRGKNIGPRVQNKKKKTYTWIITFMFMSLFIAGISVSYFYQNEKYNELLKEDQAIQAQIEVEKEKNINYKSQQEYYKSDAYIEKIAREQLGLIKSDEILIINKADE